ncbi:MAG: hypothetical protein Q8O88_06285 [bacterium]|nr:hypothetical protein [bacterium]
MFTKHKNLSPHPKYQLEIIFLYAFGVFLFLPYYLILDEFNLNKLAYQWFFFIPFILFYSTYSLVTRSKIPSDKKIAPEKRHILYWVLFGLAVVLAQMQATTVDRLVALDLSFLVFSLFLADSYWDFKKIKFFRK